MAWFALALLVLHFCRLLVVSLLFLVFFFSCLVVVLRFVFWSSCLLCVLSFGCLVLVWQAPCLVLILSCAYLALSLAWRLLVLSCLVVGLSCCTLACLPLAGLFFVCLLFSWPFRCFDLVLVCVFVFVFGLCLLSLSSALCLVFDLCCVSCRHSLNNVLARALARSLSPKGGASFVDLGDENDGFDSDEVKGQELE